MQQNDTVILKNERILLIRRPDGLPKRDDFRTEIVDLCIPSIYFCPYNRNINATASSSSSTIDENNCDIVLQTLHISIDPAMRGWMSSAKSYLPPVQLGTVMRASCICRIVGASSGLLQDDYPIGSIVRTEIVGVQSYYLLKNCTRNKAHKLLTRLDQNFDTPSPQQQQPLLPKTHLSYASFLGVLGTTGLTAYFGLLKVGRPKASDVLLVSGAAGATGSIVAQIAKHVIGCQTVIGTAGSDAKCRWLESNGVVDVAINYKTTKSLSRAIAKATNNRGVDLVFDNVGSSFLEAALSNLAMGARIVLCGAISQYNASSRQAARIAGPRNYMNLLVKRATMTGFVVLDYKKEFPTAIAQLVQWIAQQKITCYKEDTRHLGISNFYPALLSLFRGTNIGKVVLTLQDNHITSIPHQRSKL